MLNDSSVPRAPRWPFLFGDALLLGCALLIYSQATLPLGPWEIAGVVTCVGLGAWLAIWPYRLDYQGQMRLAETRRLTDAVAQIQKMDDVASHIVTATGQ